MTPTSSPKTQCMAEWGRTDLDYVSRAGHLTGAAGGLNGGVYLNSSTIADDGVKDELYGEGGLDLFLRTSTGPNADDVNDLFGGEWVNPLG